MEGERFLSTFTAKNPSPTKPCHPLGGNCALLNGLRNHRKTEKYQFNSGGVGSYQSLAEWAWIDPRGVFPHESSGEIPYNSTFQPTGSEDLPTISMEVGTGLKNSWGGWWVVPVQIRHGKPAPMDRGVW